MNKLIELKKAGKNSLLAKKSLIFTNFSQFCAMEQICIFYLTFKRFMY